MFKSMLQLLHTMSELIFEKRIGSRETVTSELR
jgi:hypothetical protein